MGEESQLKMLNCDYVLLLEELADGRKIEFRYKDSLVEIFNADQGWCVIIDNKKSNNYYIALAELIEKVKIIDNKTIKEIFELGLFSHKLASYNYKLLLKDLSMGREIEFQYENVVYGICHFAEGWIFIANNKNKSDYFKNPMELVEKVHTHDGKAIEEIFNKQMYSNENFYIL